MDKCTAANKDCLARSPGIIKSTCREMRREKIAVQHHVRSRKLRGHYSGVGIAGNSEALGPFSHGKTLLEGMAESPLLRKPRGVETLQPESDEEKKTA